MADAPDPAPEPKDRGPVKYIAFAEVTPGHWVLMGEAGREATSVNVLRKEVRAELDAANDAAGLPPNDAHNLVIVPFDRAHIVTAARETEVRETFKKATLEPGPDLTTVILPMVTEADVAARMAGGTPPPGAVVMPTADPPPHADAPPIDPTGDPDDMAAARRAEAEAIAAAQTNPDVDPDTLLSRRTADQAVPEDEGNTVFPMDER